MCFDLTHAPVATAARAAATGLVNMSTRPDPEGSGTVEIATRRCPRLRVVWDLRELTHNKNPGYGAFPPDLVQLRSTLPVGTLVLAFICFCGISSQSEAVHCPPLYPLHTRHLLRARGVTGTKSLIIAIDCSTDLILVHSNVRFVVVNGKLRGSLSPVSSPTLQGRSHDARCGMKSTQKEVCHCLHCTHVSLIIGMNGINSWITFVAVLLQQQQ